MNMTYVSTEAVSFYLVRLDRFAAMLELSHTSTAVPGTGTQHYLSYILLNNIVYASSLDVFVRDGYHIIHSLYLEV